MPEPPPPPLADAEEPPPPEADDAPPPSLPPQPAQPPAAARSSATSVSSAAAAAAAAASFPPDDALLYSCDAALLVTVKATLAGRLDIHRKHVHFEAAPPQPGASPAAGPPPYSAPPPPPSKSHWRWPVSSLVSVHCQRYCLQARALELFTDTRTSAFVALPSRPELRRAAAALLRARPGLLLLDRRRKAEAAARACDRWRRRELSTFHYLTLLNTLAGRTFNDLAQYPVFPWVIADYSSDELDVRCPGALRDLSRPVGALNPASRPSLVERFASLSRDGDGDGSLPPFHHGSHYSTPGGVLHWLLRLQPFTELHRALHGGSFDKADRLFGSLPGAWGAAWRNGSDVKELTPEFFTSPEFLINSGGHALGTRQDGSRVGDVALPPWVGGDAAAFVRANAAVLESEPVSQSIHGWIDLIFGHAQKGPPAEEALNVFFHLTYEGGVDLSRVPPDQRASLADQIALFGQARIAERRICKCQLLNQYLLQIPTQLFTRKHPRRDPPLWLPPRLSAASWQHGGCFHAPPEVALQADARAIASPSTAHPRHSGGVRFLWVTPDGRVGALTDGGVVGWHALGRPGGGVAGASAAPPSAASAASAAGAAALAGLSARCAPPRLARSSSPNCSSSSRCLGVSCRGTATCSRTNWSPVALGSPSRGRPRPRRRSVSPGCVPAGTLISVSPLRTGTRTAPPSAAVSTPMEASTWRCGPSRVKRGWSRIDTLTSKLPAGCLPCAGSPAPGTLSVVPLSTPGGMVNDTSRPCTLSVRVQPLATSASSSPTAALRSRDGRPPPKNWLSMSSNWEASVVEKPPDEKPPGKPPGKPPPGKPPPAPPAPSAPPAASKEECPTES